MRSGKRCVFKGDLIFSIFLLIGFFLINPLLMSKGFCAETPKENSSATQVFKLGEVVVSEAKETKETPSTITVITAEDIEKYHANNLGEAFRFVPGML
jgi:outer membrane receptor for ferrienterochelin and colicin